MSFHVICSTADGNQTKEFSNWEDAHQYANEWMDGFTHWNHRHFNNVESSEYVNLWKTRNGETVKIQEIKSDDCPNCADQASIAAPGQTVLCNTHADEKHFREMKEFFIEEVERITFRPHLPFCSCCGKETSQYVGIIVTNSSGPLSFSFCIDCRDELTLKQNAAHAAQERIGA